MKSESESSTRHVSSYIRTMYNKANGTLKANPEGGLHNM
jgi:hypothetical protein